MRTVEHVTWHATAFMLATVCFVAATFSPLTSFADDNNGNNSIEFDSDSDGQLVSVLTHAVLATPPANPLQDGRRIRRVEPQDNTPLDAAKVRKAIKNGVRELKQAQRANGSWPDSRVKGDASALCALSLLIAGESPNDPNVAKGLEYIRDIPTNSTYFVSLRIMAFVAADPKGKKYVGDLKRDVQWLLKTRGLDGGWSYGQSMGRMQPSDGSNAQFALLALHEASRVGVRIQKTEWEKIAKYWERVHRKTGGFGYYINGTDSRGSMTCAGISSWIIAQENLADPLQEVNGEFANCCRVDDKMEMVERAFNWLAKAYTVRTNPGGHSGTVLYYLYGLERAGRLSGRRFIGPHDWYRDGAKRLLSWQSPDGSWATRNGHGEDEPHVGTALALLFLSKGKRPVAIGKFDHGVPNWDLHPKGVNFLTRRLEREWSMNLNWQTVKAEGSTVDDLLEAPVLFMSGKDAIGLSAEEKKNLKLYLENGGFLFAEACAGDGCGNADLYNQAFFDLMGELFPDSDLLPLDLAHPIWGAHYPLLPNDDRPLLGLQACCRTSVVYCQKNLSCYWSLDRDAIFSHKQIQQGLKNRVEYCSRLGVNVVAYATNRQLREKGETPKLDQQQNEILAERALIFPKLLHGGGADDAPNAWRNVLKDASRLGLEMKMEKKLVPPTQESLRSFPFLFMHGRQKFSFSKDEREAIREHLERGGFLFVDSICSSQAFTDSFRKEIKEILGKPLQPIDPGHEIWMDAKFGRRIDKVTLRTKDPKVPGGFREEVTRPELEGTEIDGRLAVVFSPNDLSCALENSTVSQCTGYTKEDAVKIGTNVVLYSMLSDRR